MNLTHVSVPLMAPEYKRLMEWAESTGPTKAKQILEQSLVRVVLGVEEARYMLGLCRVYDDLLGLDEALLASLHEDSAG